MKRMRAVFRTDASHQIGTGHVTRCLTLADALRERDCECRFICREEPGNLNEQIRQRGFEVNTLSTSSLNSGNNPLTNEQPKHAAWLRVDWQLDAEQTKAAIDDTKFDWLIVDHYAIDIRWEKALRSNFQKIMVIDDLADRRHDCDLLLDQNLVDNWEHRYQGKVPANCGLMLGPEYAVLQPHYAGLHARIPPREGPIRQLLIYFGGVDENNLTGMAIDAFLSIKRKDITVDVVINPFGIHAEAIRRQVAEIEQITLHEFIPSLATLIAKADIAIGAGGTTSWERCCLGLPSIVISVAENQRAVVMELERRGLIRLLGCKEEVSQANLVQALKEVFDNGLEVSWSQHCQQQVDGRGIFRVSTILTLNAQTILRARLARLDDEDKFFQWANDSLVRQNAFNPNPIDPLTHRNWFREHLRDLDNCRLYIVDTDAGFPVGQVRFERDDDGWVIDYALDARVRGRGLGKPMLKTALLALQSSTKGASVIGYVKGENSLSRHIFEKLGFDCEKRNNKIVFHRQLIS